MGTLEPTSTFAPTNPSTGRIVESDTCRCFKGVEEDILNCLPTNGQAPMQLMNGVFCYCFEESIQLPDQCSIPTFPNPIQNDSCDATWFLQWFDLFAFDSITVSSFASIEGRLAATNNIWLNNFKTNFVSENASEIACDDLEAGAFQWALVAGQNLTLINGSVYSGEVIYGDSIVSNNFNLTTTCDSVQNATILDFDFAKSEITRISSGLMSKTANGQYTVSNGALTLTAPAQMPDDGLIIFNVMLSDILNVNSIDFNGFPDAAQVKAIVFNFEIPSDLQIPTGFEFSLPNAWDFSMLANSGFENKLIFNFGELAVNLAINSDSDDIREFYGTLLAMNVNLNAGKN